MHASRIRFAAAVMVVFLLPIAACDMRERVCRDGEYPVKAVGNRTGAACVAKGLEPPAGYVRYPSGQEPVHVDDEWHRYWQTKVVDEHGNVVSE
ncbi:SCO0607 family lipoprotein [Dactylosporangium sp. CA-233914]|uniref:SCO0607 family lipoprotein n=1 Tax=Dactylosporangium sp. CA-233914 TaxID=3239934 RepID=UPI003D911D09